jgi:hypothetical protein
LVETIGKRIKCSEELSYIGVILIPVEEVTNMITSFDAVIMGAVTERLLGLIRAIIT